MKYRFVKRRQEVSTEDINSMRDFDAVLKGSRRLLDIAYKGKLLWTLTIPAAIAVYTLVINPALQEEPQVLEQEKPIQEEIINDVPADQETTTQDLTEQVEEPKPQPATTVVQNEPKEEEPEEDFEQPAADNESIEEFHKEDVMIKAVPKNGFDEFYAFIDRELTYPELARKDSTEGHVKVLFSIERDGSVGDITVLESLGDLFDNEAIRVINRIPDWIPATFNGEPVSSRMSIKLTFKIK